MWSFGFEGRRALVTGSSTGIGRAIAQAFESNGSKVIYHSHDDPPGDLPPGATYLQFDLTNPESPWKLIDAAYTAEPKLDILINNAGAFFDTPFLEMSLERWEKTMNLNLRASYFLALAFAKRLVAEKRKGSIVLMASTNALQSEYDSTAYDTSKGGVAAMTRALALNLADSGIRVNAVAPGLIRTPSTSWLDTEPELRHHYERNIPLGRIGDPQDCAAAVLFLASDLSDYITGQILVIDGGLTIQQIRRLSVAGT